MISVAEADRLLARATAAGPVEDVALADACGRILRQDLRADRAYPAQDRSRMDGIAIAHADLAEGVGPRADIHAFRLAGLARAGEPQAAHAGPGTCFEVMTGAAIPAGADTVIPYEELDIADGVARVRAASRVRHGQFVHAAGSDCAAGDVLVPAGVRLNAAQVAVAASTGATRLRVAARPRVVVVGTGDELVDPSATPLPHQLRASNGAALAALLAPFADVILARSEDEPAALRRALETALDGASLLLVSGGVSAGKFDLVPDAFAALGVERVFHKIAQKPGKPLWFGLSGAGTPVFGLPGNPVSALVCARRYVLPLLWARSGWTTAPSPRRVRLAAPVRAGTLAQFVPVVLREDAEGTGADPRMVNGSGDFAGLAGSDGFVEIPAGTQADAAGERMSFYGWNP